MDWRMDGNLQQYLQNIRNAMRNYCTYAARNHEYLRDAVKYYYEALIHYARNIPDSGAFFAQKGSWLEMIELGLQEKDVRTACSAYETLLRIEKVREYRDSALYAKELQQTKVAQEGLARELALARQLEATNVYWQKKLANTGQTQAPQEKNAVAQNPRDLPLSPPVSLEVLRSHSAHSARIFAEYAQSMNLPL